MTRSFITKAAVVAAVATLAVIPAAAQAQFTLQLNGGVTIRDPNAGPGNPTTSGTLLLDFVPTNAGSTMGTGIVSVSENSVTNLPGLAVNQTGTIRDLAITPLGVNGLPMSDFVTIGGYTFSLTSTSGTGANLGSNPANFGPVFLTQTGNSVTATLNVEGRVFGGAFGTVGSAYLGTFTSQFLPVPGGAPVTIASIANTIATNPAGLQQNAFSATFNIAAAPTNVVPEPSTYALMVSGVAMLGGLAYRRRQQA